jgi:hypothetical protein
MKDIRAEGEERAVFRRRVFYLPGYDPFHPRRYRELYRKEGAVQAALSGYALTLRGRGPYGWHVTTETAGKLAEAEVEVLVWSDIVKASMAGGIAATYGQLLRTAWVYVASGALFRLMRLRKGPVIAALYPVGMLLVQALVAGLAGWLVGASVAWVAGALAGWVLAAVVAGLAVRGFRRLDNRFFAYYLMHDYAFTAAWGGANPPAMEARLAAFGARIRAALAEDWDEVLVVGHSSGAHLAVHVLADLVREGVPARHPALAFLSLGQVVPMVSFLPRATRLRSDLHYLSARDELVWVDVTAPGDGCAFALCDPVAVSGVAPEGKRWPLVVSAAFTQTLRPETWAALRWRFFRLHFQYLCAFDNLPGTPSDFDYFQITAGPELLSRRYAGRAPSRSRIDRALSPYTSMAE